MLKHVHLLVGRLQWRKKLVMREGECREKYPCRQEGMETVGQVEWLACGGRPRLSSGVTRGEWRMCTNAGRSVGVSFQCVEEFLMIFFFLMKVGTGSSNE